MQARAHTPGARFATHFSNHHSFLDSCVENRTPGKFLLHCEQTGLFAINAIICDNMLETKLGSTVHQNRSHAGHAQVTRRSHAGHTQVTHRSHAGHTQVTRRSRATHQKPGRKRVCEYYICSEKDLKRYYIHNM